MFKRVQHIVLEEFLVGDAHFNGHAGGTVFPIPRLHQRDVCNTYINCLLYRCNKKKKTFHHRSGKSTPTNFLRLILDKYIDFEILSVLEVNSILWFYGKKFNSLGPPVIRNATNP